MYTIYTWHVTVKNCPNPTPSACVCVCVCVCLHFHVCKVCVGRVLGVIWDCEYTDPLPPTKLSVCYLCSAWICSWMASNVCIVRLYSCINPYNIYLAICPSPPPPHPAITNMVDWAQNTSLLIYSPLLPHLYSSLFFSLCKIPWAHLRRHQKNPLLSSPLWQPISHVLTNLAGGAACKPDSERRALVFDVNSVSEPPNDPSIFSFKLASEASTSSIRPSLLAASLSFRSWAVTDWAIMSQKVMTGLPLR